MLVEWLIWLWLIFEFLRNVILILFTHEFETQAVFVVWSYCEIWVLTKVAAGWGMHILCFSIFGLIWYSQCWLDVSSLISNLEILGVFNVRQFPKWLHFWILRPWKNVIVFTNLAWVHKSIVLETPFELLGFIILLKNVHVVTFFAVQFHSESVGQILGNFHRGFNNNFWEIIM